MEIQVETPERKGNVAVASLGADYQQQARLLAGELKLPIVDSESKEYTYLLIVSGEGLALHFPQHPAYKPLIIDFTHGAIGYRSQHLKRSNELLAKAIGIKKNYRPTVIDATAGLGQDSFIIACMGCKVVMIERSCILVALVRDGLERLFAAKPALKERLDISLHHADAIDFLSALTIAEQPDVIYLDPMFPKRKKVALVKKEMQILQDLIGADTEASKLLDVALEKANKRVVVKRPRHADFLNDKQPNFSLHGKSIRFDVYVL